ncbi:MAG: undecaprenyl-diphosphate phosphatase [Planctomycetes bacterium]|nr:undecaprenyl-diphosphate phosphatase [Planctomycetota bacterium]
MLEQIILGITQGICEWLPISSEGMIVLIKTNLFKSHENLSELIQYALFLHMGTFFAALVYFHKDVWQLTKTLSNYKTSTVKNQQTFKFLITTTLISGALGYLFLKTLKEFESEILTATSIVNCAIGALLLTTGYLQLKAKKPGSSPALSPVILLSGKSVVKTEEHITVFDNILLGIMQGFAVLPGLSRSGLTVSALLLRNFNETVSLKLSFLMSLPIVLAGNIILNFKYLTLSFELLVGLLASFITGLLSIHLLIRLSQKINFGYFAAVIGILLILSIFI